MKLNLIGHCVMPCGLMLLLHATKLDKLLIRPDTHLSPVYMYYGHTPDWAEHLNSSG
jgi:hypothetical protein